MSNYKKLKFDGAQMDALLTLVEQGGSGGNGGSEWHYFDVSNVSVNIKTQVLTISQNVKVVGPIVTETMRSSIISPFGIFAALPSLSTSEIVGVAVDYSSTYMQGGTTMKLGDVISGSPWYGQVPEVTKEEFYTL